MNVVTMFAMFQQYNNSGNKNTFFDNKKNPVRIICIKLLGYILDKKVYLFIFKFSKV